MENTHFSENRIFTGTQTSAYQSHSPTLERCVAQTHATAALLAWHLPGMQGSTEKAPPRGTAKQHVQSRTALAQDWEIFLNPGTLQSSSAESGTSLPRQTPTGCFWAKIRQKTNKVSCFTMPTGQLSDTKRWPGPSCCCRKPSAVELGDFCLLPNLARDVLIYLNEAEKWMCRGCPAQIWCTSALPATPT